MKNFYLLVILFTTPLFLCAQLPSGSIAKYPLDNAAGDISGNGYNGTLSSTTASTNRFSTSGAATAFVSGIATGQLPLTLVTVLSGNFSFGYWFKTGMTANSSASWYGGNAMVDAEMCGGTTDWGTALIDGGKVCFGIGNPDITIKSAADYNNNAWHYVTITRNMAAGIIVLYVDGVQVATTAGTNTVALSAPTSIGLGKNPCASGAMYTGSLDDAIAYNRVLSAAEVTNLYNFYNGVVLPVQWANLTGTAASGVIHLQWQAVASTGNHHFEIERAADGNNFAVVGTVAAGTDTYSFTDASPLPGNNFYRIRQVDDNGRYSFSSTIKVTNRDKAADPYLQTNPVATTLVVVNNKQVMIQKLQITDVSGKIISDIAVYSKNRQINAGVQHILPGCYFLHVTGEGISITRPFLKQ